METGCVFCAIAKGDESAEVNYEEEALLTAMRMAMEVARAIKTILQPDGLIRPW